MRENTNLKAKAHVHQGVENGEWLVGEDCVHVGEHKQCEQRINNECMRAWLEFGQPEIVSGELKQYSYVFVDTLVKAIECIHCKTLI